MAKRLYVGGLSYNTTESGLKDFFAPAGTVESANIITDKISGRSKGFGFVEMSNEEEAQAAIKTLNGKKLDGRTLVINEAHPRKNRPENNSGGFNRGGGEKFVGKEQDNFNGKLYPNGYYKNGKIDEDLFDKKADEIAMYFGKRISFNKIRQYYDEVNRLYYLIKNAKSNKEMEKAEENIKIGLKLLIAKAIFDSQRNNLIPKSFVDDFLRKNEEFLKSEGEKDFAKNLEIFKKHFETIIAYGKGKDYFKK